MANNNQTYVPGRNMSGSLETLYERRPTPSSASAAGKGTIVPNMQSEPAPAAAPAQNPNTSGAPVVGFLYSISNNGCTEYWPIHLGANIIGRGEEADIRLNEATVSERHAQINVRQMRTSHRITAIVQDIGSKTGMFLNDEELDFMPRPCQNMDVLKIGEAYTLLLILVDTDANGLKAAENFRRIEVEDTPEPVLPEIHSASSRTNRHDLNSTIDLSGRGSAMEAPGGTMILE